ncbi:phosphatidylinositol-3-phosphatase SAC1 NDAI_0C02580 [Naumovozyma dairenensis CBS 421]|uniref:SAC domain-containing protein n=1 Tax=Naumovozyma dairenensis (strain ATCC 10597 / BCRC 20456 / CBS 421 / NBRC 0211 / NRRL Y-12639) TaxID=1071378 RepID=G0W807_NAUDC|nr:hypothetical protein NDAI_0C02580 [Naumovozyma dairenensis CBS 421]CCD23918.1 hypothetical protein NDAI_0C02580 [Naumovozyma dairenensis CBS 421]
MSGPMLFAQTSEGLYFKRIDGDQENVVFLSSQDQSAKLISVDHFPAASNSSAVVKNIASLIGFLKLKLNKYAIIANTVEETGNFQNNSIYKIASHSIVPCKITSNIDSDESEYLKLLELQLKTATLFFSYTYDLTNSLQRNNSSGPTPYDERFFWNHYLTGELRSINATAFIQPVIYGYAKFIETIFQSSPITIGLITRRSRFRAGTRYFRRGIDQDGNVGNFNETEQLLSVNNKDIYSFLQTRGSVPVQWAEINNLQYKPNLVLNADESSTVAAAKKHFNQQIELYGDNYLVNLVNQSGHEKPVKDAYENVVKQIGNDKLHYIYFDFHHECRKMKWHRVKLLINRLQELGLTNDDFFHMQINSDGGRKIVNLQKSTVRTNCMDCLDRTNVVQSVLAHWVLQKEFETAGIVEKDKLWENDESLLFIFQNFWADNADAVSVSYSGTGALKTDFTRTGKRTKLGAFNDFINSASRYYQNNFTDGPRQDSYDLFLGNFKPYIQSIKSPFPDRRPVLIQIIPIVILVSLTIITSATFVPKDASFFSSKNLITFFLSLITFAGSFKYLIANGIQFVNWPKLVDVGFLVCKQTHNKERVFKGLKYIQNKHFIKPKKD